MICEHNLASLGLVNSLVSFKLFQAGLNNETNIADINLARIYQLRNIVRSF